MPNYTRSPLGELIRVLDPTTGALVRIEDLNGTNFALTEGAQTLNGVKTFGAIPVFPTTGITIGSTSLTEAEAGVLDGVVAGTAAASKAVVVDANKDVTSLRNVGCTSVVFAAGGTLDSDSGTATAAAAAATVSKMAGVVTTEALTTAALASYTLTLTNTTIAAADIVFASVANGTSTTGTPLVGKIKPAAGSCAIEIYNAHATVAFNGTLVVSFFVVKA